MLAVYELGRRCVPAAVVNWGLGVAWRLERLPVLPWLTALAIVRPTVLGSGHLAALTKTLLLVWHELALPTPSAAWPGQNRCAVRS